MSARSGSARSRPGPEKKGSRRKHSSPTHNCIDGFAVKPWQARLVEGFDRLPPALANGVAALLDREIQREMGEDVADRGERLARSPRRIRPAGARKRGHSAEQPFRRSSNQPDVTIAFDPPGRAVAVRPDFARAPL